MASALERLCALALMAAMPGCASEQRPDTGGTPLFYASLASPTAEVDGVTAASLINSYRRKHGLGLVEPDAGLTRLAAASAAAMAKRDKPASASGLKSEFAAAGVVSPAVNVSAGYHTLAEAFSGWRDSPVHDATMRDARATRIGIATAYAPQSKYKVYWVLILAGARS